MITANRDRKEVIANITISRARAVLLIIDFQERLAAAMPESERAQAERNVCILIEAARRFGMPVVVSQQYPKGLGPTVPAIEEALATLDTVHRFDKVDFSACDAADFPMIHETLGEERSQWILTGMETHVCVYQTARELCEGGHSVHVPMDAVTSRFRNNWRIGLDLIGRSGGVITTTETVVFDALGRAGTDDFKALSRLIR